jgi:hypothetical protein
MISRDIDSVFGTLEMLGSEGTLVADNRAARMRNDKRLAVYPWH